MAFKMKGSPMRRNFGIGVSALKQFRDKPTKTTDQYIERVGELENEMKSEKEKKINPRIHSLISGNVLSNKYAQTLEDLNISLPTVTKGFKLGNKKTAGGSLSSIYDVSGNKLNLFGGGTIRDEKGGSISLDASKIGKDIDFKTKFNKNFEKGNLSFSLDKDSKAGFGGMRRFDKGYFYGSGDTEGDWNLGGSRTITPNFALRASTGETSGNKNINIGGSYKDKSGDYLNLDYNPLDKSIKGEYKGYSAEYNPNPAATQWDPTSQTKFRLRKSWDI